jgi:hypothetical protein
MFSSKVWNSGERLTETFIQTNQRTDALWYINFGFAI